MPEFTVTEYRWVLADYPYTVQANSKGEALLKVASGEIWDPDRVSEVDWEVSRTCNWRVRRDFSDPETWIGDDGEHLHTSRLGFIGVRGSNA
jgi:hypothetical protein